MERAGDADSSILFEGNQADIEEPIDVRGKEKPVGAIQPFMRGRAAAPGFDVAGAQEFGLVELADRVGSGP